MVSRAQPSTHPQFIKQERQEASSFFSARGQAELQRQEKGKKYKEREKLKDVGQYKGAQTFNIGVSAWISRNKYQTAEAPYPVYRGLPDGEGMFMITKLCTEHTLTPLGLLCTGIQNMQVPHNIKRFVLETLRAQWELERTFLSPSPIHPTKGIHLPGVWALARTVINGHAVNVQDLVQPAHQHMSLIEWFQMHFNEKVSKNVIEFTVHLLWKEPLKVMESSSEDDVPSSRHSQLPTTSSSQHVHSSKSPAKRDVKVKSSSMSAKQSSSSSTKIKKEKSTKPAKDTSENDQDTATEPSSYQHRIGEARTTRNSTGRVPGQDVVLDKVRDVVSYYVKQMVSEMALKLELALLACSMACTPSPKADAPRYKPRSSLGG
jgi:hypothetical protein